MPQKSDELVNALAGREWQIGMLEAPCRAPGHFCCGAFCPWCTACRQREEILELIGEPYVCCGGGCPCCGLNKPCPDGMDTCCLVAEVICCPIIAVTTNRYYIQTRFGRENSACDDYIITYTAVLQCISCILSCVAACCFPELRDVAELVAFCADLAQCCCLGCMYAQQDTELDYVSQFPYNGPPGHIRHLLPPEQQEMLTK
mmetsp:Transcript_6370/g.13920  ORF Transcript_6370/g.13920 Transcript_6370/m.13920 type:complete len:202 (-) Transcript_6370:159-764(-)|eukprot:CAMPEP_0178415348 /NCGR_PEP_ID=MMETSP0689_2-20121128/23505_1 /TAXON_ID=160604 /ORGANISM="Amphidinium massartii, Strain CS-259" /LENGTH=201 /DNA_ID=CAMNT_0020036665 /DNA_START=30 /DNA_END=635 /DNA_ORIENTATION=+